MSSPRIKVLVVQFADLGDLMLASPAIEYLRRPEQNRHITIVTKPGNRQLAQSIADDVLAIDKHLYDHAIGLLNPLSAWKLVSIVRSLRRRQFDEVYLLHHLVTRWGALKFRLLLMGIGAQARIGLDDGRGGFLTSRKHDLGFGAASESNYWRALTGAGPGALRVRPSNDSEFLKSAGVSGRYVVLHPGSGTFSTARRWPVERFAELAMQIHDALGSSIVVVGGPQEVHLGETIAGAHPDLAVNIAGKTDLETLTSVLQHADLFVGNDGGVAQLAGKMSTPSVIIYGPTSPVTWKPVSDVVHAVRLDLPCAPCLYHEHTLGTPEGCATRECLFGLPVSAVMREVSDLMSELRAA